MKFKKLMKTMSLKHASNKNMKRSAPAYAKSLYSPSLYAQDNLPPLDVLFPASHQSLDSSYNSSLDNTDSTDSEYMLREACPVSKVASQKKKSKKPAPPSQRVPRVGLRLDLHGHGRETTPTHVKHRNGPNLHGPERSPSPKAPSRKLRLDLHGPEIGLYPSEDECISGPGYNAISPEAKCFGVGSQWKGFNTSLNKFKRRSSRIFKRKDTVASDSTESSLQSATMPSSSSSLHFLPTYPCGAEGSRRISTDLCTSSTPSEHIGIAPISDESSLSDEGTSLKNFS